MRIQIQVYTWTNCPVQHVQHPVQPETKDLGSAWGFSRLSHEIRKTIKQHTWGFLNLQAAYYLGSWGTVVFGAVSLKFGIRSFHGPLKKVSPAQVLQGFYRKRVIKPCFDLAGFLLT